MTANFWNSPSVQNQCISKDGILQGFNILYEKLPITSITQQRYDKYRQSFVDLWSIGYMLDHDNNNVIFEDFCKNIIDKYHSLEEYVYIRKYIYSVKKNAIDEESNYKRNLRMFFEELYNNANLNINNYY